MKYRIIGYGDRDNPDNHDSPRGVTEDISLSDLPEHIMMALLISKCRFVEVDAEIPEESGLISD